MATDIVIVNYNTRDLLEVCIDSVLDAIGPDDKTIVVDNASSDGSADMVRKKYPSVDLVALDTNTGFGAGNNHGIQAGGNPLVLFLNSDAQLQPGALDTLLATMREFPDCTIAGPRLIYPDGSFQASCRHFPSFLRNFWWLSGMQGRVPNHLQGLQNWLSEAEHNEGKQVDMVSGACFLTRRGFLDAITGFDEDFFLYEEEFDLCREVSERGGEVRFCPGAVVVHAAGASVDANQLSTFSQRHLFRSKYNCFRKHYGAAYAWCTHLSDCAILRISACRHRHDKDNEPARLLRICREAYRQSYVPLAKLRQAPDFFKPDA